MSERGPAGREDDGARAVRETLAAALAVTGGEPALRASPSSGGLHPVEASGTALRVRHAISAAKYGSGGPLCAETDVGAVLEIAATLLAARGGRPVVVEIWLIRRPPYWSIT